MKKFKLVILAIATLAAISVASCSKGTNCTCNGVSIGTTDDWGVNNCADACTKAGH